MANDIPVPEFIDVSSEATEAAAAAMNRNTVFVVPEDAEESTDSKGNNYFRWSEPAVITGAWREASKSGLLTAMVQYKIRVGSTNGGATNWGRHMLNIQLMQGIEGANKNHQFMNDRSLNALTTLFKATGFAPTEGGLTAKLLNFMFPVKNSPGVTSQLVGKPVVVNLVDQPNTGEGAKTDRQTQVESYLPDEE